MDNNFARIQIIHKPQPNSNPYLPASIENALKQLGLSEAQWSPAYFDPPGQEYKERECIVRHETGAEIIILVTAVVSFATAITNLIAQCKKNHPEIKVQITVSSLEDLDKVTKALKEMK